MGILNGWARSQRNKNKPLLYTVLTSVPISACLRAPVKVPVRRPLRVLVGD